MTQKEILAQLISRVVSGEYELCEVRRSNHDELQEYDFVIKEATHTCCVCGDKAELELDDGRWICNSCAQIQGELAEFRSDKENG